MILKQSLLKFFKTGAIPLLLSTVALRQIVLVHTAGLSPWHGGGFGMFASIDRDERRMVTAQLECAPTENVALPGLLTDSPNAIKAQTYTHISTFPTKSQIQRLGQLLANSEDIAQNAPPCEDPWQLQAWRLVYKDGAIAYEPISSPVEVKP